MPESRLAALRRRIKDRPVVSFAIALFTIGGTALHWATVILDWASRFDTWNAHSREVIHTASVVAAQMPPWTWEACYGVSVLLILIVAFFRREGKPAATTGAAMTAAAVPAILSPPQPREQAPAPITQMLAAPNLRLAQIKLTSAEFRPDNSLREVSGNLSYAVPAWMAKFRNDATGAPVGKVHNVGAKITFQPINVNTNIVISVTGLWADGSEWVDFDVGSVRGLWIAIVPSDGVPRTIEPMRVGATLRLQNQFLMRKIEYGVRIMLFRKKDGVSIFDQTERLNPSL